MKFGTEVLMRASLIILFLGCVSRQESGLYTWFSERICTYNQCMANHTLPLCKVLWLTLLIRISWSLAEYRQYYDDSADFGDRGPVHMTITAIDIK